MLTQVNGVNEPDKNIFAIRAKCRLVELGWTVASLAERMGRPRSTVSRAIHTNNFPNVRKKIARRLGISLSA